MVGDLLQEELGILISSSTSLIYTSNLWGAEIKGFYEIFEIWNFCGFFLFFFWRDECGNVGEVLVFDPTANFVC